MFAQPWAWLGLAGLAVPVAIHLLARHQATRAAFPTLRFIAASDLNAVRRHRLTDIPLLLIRMAAIAAVVAAIAGPQLRAATIGPAAPAQALVVEPDIGDAHGPSTLAPAPAIALRPESLRAGLESAAAWAGRQPAAEIIVRSYFQRGVLDDAAIARVPSGIGLRFERVRLPVREGLAGLRIADDATSMTWEAARGTSVPNLRDGPGATFVVSAGPAEREAETTVAAVLGVIPAVAPGGAPVRLVFPPAPEYARLQSSLPPIDEKWMYEVARSVADDAALSGSVKVGASGGEMTVLIDADPSSARAAEIVHRLAIGCDRARSAASLETTTIPDDVLRRWERAPSADGSRPATPQGRWLWLAAIVLMSAELWVRRRG